MPLIRTVATADKNGSKSQIETTERVENRTWPMNLRWYVIDAVFARNLQSYFSGVLGYLFIVVYVALGALALFSEQFFANNLATLDQLTLVYPQLLLFIVPAIAMTTWAEERRQGTDELLFTLPASDLEILLGKFLSVVGVYGLALLFSLSHVVVLSVLGTPDWGVIFANYVGYLLAGVALLAVAMVASILTNSVTVAYVLGSVFCSAFVFIDRLGPVAEFLLRPLGVTNASQWIAGFSVGEQLRDFGQGMVPLQGVLYFVFLAVVMLYVNLVLISRRHWSAGPQSAAMGSHFTVRAIALAIALLSIGSILGVLRIRGDLTREKIYTLNPATRKILNDIPDKRPVLIRAFVSPTVPRDYVVTQQNLLGILGQFDRLSRNVESQIIMTTEASEQAEQARAFGIEPRQVQTDRGGRFVVDNVYLSAVVTSGADDEVVIPFFNTGTPIEYELARSIQTVTRAKRPLLGILRTDAKIEGGFDMGGSFRQIPEARFTTELKKQYEVRPVSPADLAAESFDVLLAVMPSSLTKEEMEPFVTYVKSGKPVLVIDDPIPMFRLDLAPRQPKPRTGGGPFGGGAPPQPKADGGTARSLCDALDIEWRNGDTVWDTFDPHPALMDLFRNLNVVYIGENPKSRAPFSQSSEITRGLQEVMLFYPGRIRPRAGSKLTFTPLLRSSSDASILSWEEATEPPSGMAAFLGGGPQLVPSPPRPPPTGDEEVIAAKISGEIPADPATPGDPGRKINVIFVADSDLMADGFMEVRESRWLGLQLDNITFLLNCIDDLAGETGLIPIRKRRSRQRTLKFVENATQKYRNQQNAEQKAAEDEAKRKLNEVQEKLDEDVRKIEEDTMLDPRTKAIQQEMAKDRRQRELDVAKAGIDTAKAKSVRRARDKAEREVRRIENSVWLFAVLLPPVPALLLGLFVLSSRSMNERLGLNPKRMTGKRN
jgi:ABC-2 type transport system permease protein